MITIQTRKTFTTGDGETCFVLADAQAAELCGLGVGITSEQAKAIVQNKAAIIDVLTLTDASKPRARRINGGTKKRRPAAAAPADGAVVAGGPQ